MAVVVQIVAPRSDNLATPAGKLQALCTSATSFPGFHGATINHESNSGVILEQAVHIFPQGNPPSRGRPFELKDNKRRPERDAQRRGISKHLSAEIWESQTPSLFFPLGDLGLTQWPTLSWPDEFRAGENPVLGQV